MWSPPWMRLHLTGLHSVQIAGQDTLGHPIARFSNWGPARCPGPVCTLLPPVSSECSRCVGHPHRLGSFKARPSGGESCDQPPSAPHVCRPENGRGALTLRLVHRIGRCKSLWLVPHRSSMLGYAAALAARLIECYRAENSVTRGCHAVWGRPASRLLRPPSIWRPSCLPQDWNQGLVGPAGAH